MNVLPPRTVAVGTTPTNIRKTPAAPNDPAAYPVTYSMVTVPTGANVRFVPFSNSVWADGEPVIVPDIPYTDDSQAIERYLISQSGTVNVNVVDRQA